MYFDSFHALLDHEWPWHLCVARLPDHHCCHHGGAHCAGAAQQSLAGATSGEIRRTESATVSGVRGAAIMHPVRKQRLYLVLFVALFSSVAVGLVLYALRGNINLFYPPADVVRARLQRVSLFGSEAWWRKAVCSALTIVWR